ncbi:MAG: tRNA 2-thiouridine(34) synthase MnmA [Bacteroidales bacterium]|nr:tRNA 2-thiouridine(34) synthase MnmA [Bacteroidales bacterium]
MHLLQSLAPVPSSEKVLLGMSGGTDSSVAAILLKESGYDVTGVTFRFFEKEEGDLSSANDAAEVASKLGIKHIIYDARTLFEKEIIRYFIREYIDGRTPVPCMLCNNFIKWPLLMKIADENGIKKIATGHYARIIHYNNHLLIAKGSDPDKDQSFFLWGISKEIRNRMLLPLGTLLKKEIRETAQKKGFYKIAQKKDSIGVCFCPEDYRPFLRKYADPSVLSPGFFIDEKGTILGKHQGYPYYTVGQRRGLGLNLQQAMYVKEIRKEENLIVLSELKSLYKQEMIVKDYQLCAPEYFDFKHIVICKIRYRKQATPSIVKQIDKNYLYIKFLEPLEMVAPGQSAAFYDNDMVVGGGIIDSAS